MEDSTGGESHLSQTWAKLTVCFVIPTTAALNSMMDLHSAGVGLGEANLAYLAGSFFGGALFLSLCSLGFGSLARRHKKSRFWPTAAWVAIASSIMVLLGNLGTSGTPWAG